MKDKLRNKKYQILQIGIMLLLGVLFYICAGDRWVSLEDDSQFYLKLTRQEGVMPIYPIFLFLLRITFREEVYLNIAVFIQSVLAIVCTMIFSLFLQKRFYLKSWEDILIFLACMLPFSIYLPESGITHQIMTEGIAYPLFYIYFLFLLKYVIDEKVKWCIITLAMAALLSLIRSQLMLLLIVTMLVFCIKGITNSAGKTRYKKIKKFAIRAVVSAVTILSLIVVINKAQSVLSVYNLTYLFPDEWDRIIAIDNQKGDSVSEQEKQNYERNEELNTIIRRNNSNNGKTSQFVSLLAIRGLYEADATDVELFQNEETKELFKRSFQAIDEKKYRYVYARRGLYMWKDLVCDKIPNEIYEQYLGYLQDNPTSTLEYASTLFEMGWKTLIHHFDRYLYHTMRLMISGFISSIFFQIEKIYFFCHLITLGLYLSAIIGVVICYREKGNKNVIAFMSTILLFLILMVIIINGVFLGLQRYMVYGMGIFYCAYYLLIREVYFLITKRKHSDSLL